MNSTEDPSSCNSRPTPAQKQALDQYFERMQKRLEVYAGVITEWHQDAPDLVNQAYIEIWATMRNNPQMTATPDDRYGFGVIKNLWRRRMKVKGQTVSLASIPDYDDPKVESALRELEQEATDDYLRTEHFTRPEKLSARQASTLINWLPAESQRIVLMRSEGMSFEVIGAELGMSAEDASKRHNSARTRLRSLLKKLLGRGEG